MVESLYDEKFRRKYLNRIECRKFRKVVDKLAFERRIFCRLLYCSGCRISEVLNLTIDKIDISSNVVIIRSLKKRKKPKKQSKQRRRKKSKKKVKLWRRIPIPSDLVKNLLELAEPCSENRLFSFSRTTGWRIIKKLMMECEISGPQATCKGLRHSFGVRCVMSGIPLNTIQLYMGHEDPETTAIYLEVMHEESRELIEKTWEIW